MGWLKQYKYSNVCWISTISTVAGFNSSTVRPITIQLPKTKASSSLKASGGPATDLPSGLVSPWPWIKWSMFAQTWVVTCNIQHVWSINASCLQQYTSHVIWEFPFWIDPGDEVKFVDSWTQGDWQCGSAVEAKDGGIRVRIGLAHVLALQSGVI